MLEIKEYLTPEGRSPFAEWLREFRDVQIRARVAVRLNRLRLANFGDCKSVGQGVHELRLAFGPGYRVYFAREDDRVILLLCGGDKGSQVKDIRRAQGYWREYRSHRHG
jgi:putative addiction module killer protein